MKNLNAQLAAAQIPPRSNLPSPGHSVVTPVPEFTRPASLGCFLPLVQKLAQARRAQEAGLIMLFCSLSRGEGVTYVVESLAWELSKYVGERVLITTPTSLENAAMSVNPEIDPSPHPVLRMPESGVRRRTEHDLDWVGLQALRRQYGFVLVDGPALRASSQSISVAGQCDGIILVVAAGEAKRSEIEYAQAALDSSPAKLLGVVLNKRTDAIPQSLMRLL